jgi:RNA polymerase sigma factor (sigma-70 family)
VEVSALKPSAVPALRGPVGLLRLQSDERLIALVRRGNHGAFEALVARYQSRLLAFCRHMLGSREDAEDVLQEVFAAAFNAMLADERPINARPWLYRIARNRSLNHLRRTSAVGVDSMDVHYADNGLSTAERVLRRESFMQLIDDVHKLAETQRTALLLREIDALSYEQIADVMETTVPAVKSLLVRARISLAEAAEARALSCEQVRIELGEVAEGLVKRSPAVRRHVRECERCRAFQAHLKGNNVALAAVLPVGPLLLLKKLTLAKLGSTAGAGGAHVASAGSAGAAAGAAGSASVGTAGSIVTAGASALAAKAAAGLAVAAIVTAGTVEADHATSARPHQVHRSTTTVMASSPPEPIVTRSTAQPVSVTAPPPVHPRPARAASKPSRSPAKDVSTTAKSAPSPTAPADTPIATDTPSAEADKAIQEKPQTPPAVTEVTTETTQLSSATTSTSSSSHPPPSTTTTGGTPPPAETTPQDTSTGEASPAQSAPGPQSPSPSQPSAPESSAQPASQADPSSDLPVTSDESPPVTQATGG